MQKVDGTFHLKNHCSAKDLNWSRLSYPQQSFISSDCQVVVKVSQWCFEAKNKRLLDVAQCMNGSTKDCVNSLDIQTVSFVLCEKAIVLFYQSQTASSVPFLVMLIIWGKIAWFLIPSTNLLPFIYAKKVVQHDVAILPVDMILFFPLPVRCSVRQRAAYFSHAAIHFAINLEWPENSGTDTVEVCK